MFKEKPEMKLHWLNEKTWFGQPIREKNQTWAAQNANYVQVPSIDGKELQGVYKNAHAHMPFKKCMYKKCMHKNTHAHMRARAHLHVHSQAHML